MYIGMLNFKSIKSKKIWIVILTAITVAIVLIGITIYQIVNDENVNIGIGNKINIFDIKKYDCGANVKIYGNKTINDYYIEEEYESIDEQYKYKFKAKNESNSEVSYLIENNTLKISSDSQISEYILSDYIVKKSNILSFSTFISMYNDVEKYIKENNNSDYIKIEIEEIEDKTCYRMIINNSKIDILNEYKDIFKEGMNINKFELFILNETNIPKEYIIYDKNDNAYIDIQYTFFSL